MYDLRVTDDKEKRKLDSIRKDLSNAPYGDIAAAAVNLLQNWAINETNEYRAIGAFDEHTAEMSYYTAGWLDVLEKERNRAARLGPKTSRETGATDISKFTSQRKGAERSSAADAPPASVSPLMKTIKLDYGPTPRDYNAHLQVFCETRDEKRLDEIGKAIGIENRASVMMAAIDLLKWSIDEVKSGKMLSALDEKNQQYHMFETEYLTRIAIERDHANEKEKEPSNVAPLGVMNKFRAHRGPRTFLDIGATATVTELKSRKDRDPSDGSPSR